MNVHWIIKTTNNEAAIITISQIGADLYMANNYCVARSGVTRAVPQQIAVQAVQDAPSANTQHRRG